MFTADHEHKVDVQDASFLNCVLALQYRQAEIWEHASPRLPVHVQCAHKLLPFVSAAIQGCRGGAVSF